MSWSLWLTLVATGALISFTPGAGAVNTMANSLGSGWTRSIWGILGQQVALFAHIAVVAAGISVPASRAHRCSSTSSGMPAPPTSSTSGSASSGRAPRRRGWVRCSGEPAWSMFRRGLLVNLTNPKAVVFFLAFTPQFIRPEQPLLPQYAVLAATVIAIDVIVMWFFFAAAARGLGRLTQRESGQRTLNRVFGGLFVGVGVLLAAVH